MSAVRLYLRSRRLHVLAVVLVLLAVLSTLVGGRVLSLGSAEHPASMPYRFVLAALASSCVVSSLASPLPLLDGASGVVARARWLHLAAAALVCTALLGGADLLGSADGGRTALTSLRSTLTWLGLALLSSALLRESLSWVLPLAGVFLLVWFGSPYGSAEAWNWVAAPVDASLSWYVMCGVVGGGAVAQWLVWSRSRRSGR
ncbi:hypothetical protein [Actinomyces sp. oral taxon 897]|uniref:hypothetical protein n=1 Tax=Actinomyces sp. oral taxon 897 TaxID=2081702 RepID=UPI00101AD2B1|nr:hypothetical protein [Actinomyces sp. oral taxon 897]